MINLPKPEDPAGIVFETCISRIKDGELKRRLELCKSEVVQVTNEFAHKAPQARLHTIAASGHVANSATAEEMIKVYTDRMAKKRAPGRHFYDKIMALPDHGRCPLCGQRTVSTIDHHLPKAHFPALVVSPINLIPSCKDCNTNKTDGIPTSSREETLHPYFDDIDHEIWIKARLIEDEPISIIYFADPPECWEAILADRIIYHFEIFKLIELYGSHAAEEISNIELISRAIFRSTGKQGLKEYLEINVESHRRNRNNSWQTALYRCLSESEFYCNQRFNENG